RSSRPIIRTTGCHCGGWERPWPPARRQPSPCFGEQRAAHASGASQTLERGFRRASLVRLEVKSALCRKLGGCLLAAAKDGDRRGNRRRCSDRHERQAEDAAARRRNLVRDEESDAGGKRRARRDNEAEHWHTKYNSFHGAESEANDAPTSARLSFCERLTYRSRRQRGRRPVTARRSRARRRRDGGRCRRWR